MKPSIIVAILCITAGCSRGSERSTRGEVDTVMVFEQTRPSTANPPATAPIDSSALALSEPLPGSRFAIFSNLHYVEETGDAVGRELELWGDPLRPTGKYREAEGSLGCTHTMAVRIHADSIQFEHPQYGTYHGLLLKDTIRGRFSGEIIEDTLVRASEPYRETRPCRR